MFPFALGPKNYLGGTARVFQDKIHTSSRRVSRLMQRLIKPSQ